MLGQATRLVYDPVLTALLPTLRLAICCGLDRIPSSTAVITTSDKRWPAPTRNFEYSLPLPKTRTELGERIGAL